MPVVLGLDQSSNCGWAVLSPDRRPLCGVWKLPLRRDDETAAFVTLFDRVDETIQDRGVTHVVFEMPFEPDAGRGNRRVSDIQKQYCALIMAAAGRRGLIAEQVPIAAWRKRFMGLTRAAPGLTQAGAASAWWKREALAACARYGFDVADHNAAEAIGIAHYKLCLIDRGYDSRTVPMFRRLQMEKDSAA